MSRKEKEIDIFNFGENAVRTTMMAGEPWFVARDVCNALEIKHTGTALKLLDGDEKNTVVLNHSINTPGNPRKVLVNESGLYALIMSSRKSEAKKFRKWVTQEVLPTIRKTGGYIVPTDKPVTMEGVEDIVAESAKNHQMWLNSRKENIKLVKKNMDLENELSVTVTKEDIISLKEEFKVFRDITNSKLDAMAYKSQSPSVLRKELKPLIKRYANKNNLEDKYVWGELYKELGKEYHVSIISSVDKNKLDHVSDYGLLPEAIEMLKVWIADEETSLEIF